MVKSYLKGSNILDGVFNQDQPVNLEAGLYIIGYGIRTIILKSPPF